MASDRGIGKYWRVVLIGVLGGALAFASSYLVSPTYQSSTRLIIHGRDAGFLSSSGQNDPSQATITDASQAKALADTYGSIATSRSLAIHVVDELHLDKPKTGSGFLHSLAGAAATAYRCGRAIITAGFCAKVDRHEQAITDVQTGTTALQLGATAGDSAGQPGSYVLEITASGDSGATAQATANAIADELVKTSTQLVAADSATYVTKLKSQLTAANATIKTETAQLTKYQSTHHISAADQQLVATATSYDNLKADLSTAKADLADAQGQLGSVQSALANTPSTVSTDQRISTGRSSNTVSKSSPNPAYSDLVTQRNVVQAKVTGLKARIPELQGQVAAGSPTTLSGPLARLANLQNELTNAQKSQASLSTQVQQATTQAATAQPDLSRIDHAGKPAYPTSPKRYLYLLIGLLLGALAGGALTWLAARRRNPVAPAEHDDDDPIDEVATDDDRDTQVLPLLGLGAYEGAGTNGSGPQLEPAHVGVGTNGYPATNGNGAHHSSNGNGAHSPVNGANGADGAAGPPRQP